MLQKGNLSLFSTNTDGCCFKWGLVLVKHDKVRDDTPLVTKVWRSSNASAVAFFQPRQPLVHVSAANKRGEVVGAGFQVCLFCHVSALKLRNGKMNKNFTRRRLQDGSQKDSSMVCFLSHYPARPGCEHLLD